MESWLTIREVTERTGVPAATLRAWERRYGFPIPQRTAGGHRRYSSADVEKLEQAHQLVAEGWSAGTAVRHVEQGGAAADVITLAPPAPTVVASSSATDTIDGLDAEVLVLVTSTLRALLRAGTVEAVPGLLADVVTTLGGEIVDADEAGPDALPIDVSLGVTQPKLPTAEPYTLARMRIESVLPRLVEDAHLVVERLRALAD